MPETTSNAWMTSWYWTSAQITPTEATPTP